MMAPWILPLIPLVGATFVCSSPLRWARIVAVGSSLCTLFATCILLYTARGTSLAATPIPGVLLSLDGTALLFCLLTTLTTAALFIGAPRSAWDRRALATVMFAEAACLGLFLAHELMTFAVCWTLSLAPLLARTHEGTFDRVGKIYALACLLPVWIFVGLADAAPHLPVLALSSSTQNESLEVLCLVAAIFCRIGLFPMHSWLPHLFQRARLGKASFFVTTFPGVYLLARLGRPLLTRWDPHALSLLAAGAVVTALLGALMSLGHRHLRGLASSMAMSASGLITIGLASSVPEGTAGGLVQVITFGLAFTGLSLAICAVEARYGTTEIESLSGIAFEAPGLAIAFLLCGLAAIGFPGFLGFVGDDLLIHGALESYPAVTVVMLIASAVNAIAFMRGFLRAFTMRQHPESASDLDLVPRERWTMALIVAALAALGMAPHLVQHLI